MFVNRLVSQFIAPETEFIVYSRIDFWTVNKFSNTTQLYTGTPNSNIRILYTVHYGRNVNKPSWSWRTTAIMWYYSPTKKTSQYIKLERVLMIFGFLVNMENTIAIYSYSTPWAHFPQKWFFVLISSHCSTQIRHMRYGGSWSK